MALRTPTSFVLDENGVWVGCDTHAGLRYKNSVTTLQEHLLEQPFTLVMSSGFFSFFAHAGMNAALEERGIRPAGYAGSSAGALVGACRAAGLAPEAIRDEFFELRKKDFWDPSIPACFKGGFLDGGLFRSRLAQLLPARFEETQVPLQVSVYDVVRRRTTALLEGNLPSAVHASCAVPLMFRPVWRRGRVLLDGGILDRPGLHGLPPGPVLYHHIMSRSPWRRASALEIPSRPEMTSLAIKGLPRVGPSALDRGPLAYARAKAATLRALSRPFSREMRISS